MRSTIMKLIVPGLALTALVGCEASGILDAKAPKGKKACAKILTYDVLSDVTEKANVTYGTVSAECGALLHTSASAVDNKAYKKSLLLIKPEMYAENSDVTAMALGSDLNTAAVKAALAVAELTLVSPAVTVNDDPPLLTGTMILTLTRTAAAGTATEYVIGLISKGDKDYVVVDAAPEEDETSNSLSSTLSYFGTYQVLSSATALEAGEFEIE